MSALYRPPYDSPIEDRFARYFCSYASSDVMFEAQVVTETLCGRFILDFVITVDGRKIAVECDGKEFHNESRDEWRDAMILGESHVDVIYRIRGADLHYRIEDVFWVLASLEPVMFESRAIAKLRTIASDEALQRQFLQTEDLHTVRYPHEQVFLMIEGRSNIIPSGQRRFWRTAYEYAASLKGGPLDEVIKSYRGQRN